MKLNQNWTSGFREEDFFLRNFHVHIVQEAPIHQSQVYGHIKISPTVFERGHPRNIPVKLFQNRTRGFREEDFLRISSCPYNAKNLPPMVAMVLDRSEFRKQSLKRVTQGTIL